MDKIIYDCETEEHRIVPLTEEEEAVHAATREAWQAELAQEDAAFREQSANERHDHETIRAVALGSAQPDSAFAAAVARRLGIALD